MIPLLLRLARRAPHSHLAYRQVVRWVPVRERTLDRWFADRNVFLVVSTGRTGTKWLAGLLAKARDTVVEHEPVPVETLAHRDAAMEPSAAVSYVREFRRKEIYLRVRARGPGNYGEVNGALRRHVDAMRGSIPNLRLVHLVRDGRDVVRSIVSRHTYGGGHPVYDGYRPPPVDPWARRWEELSEFERACWVWRAENEHMRERIPARARLEDLTASWDLFRRQILGPLELELDHGLWREQSRQVRNRTGEHELPGWSGWSEEQRATFLTICGEEMAAYGYDLDRA